jgi:UDPglucose 6-dehydrogenase
MPRVAIIGYGVVGQAVGAVLAAKVKGAKVSAFDPQQKSWGANRVRVASSFRAAVVAADYVFLCVPSHLGGKGVNGKVWERLAGQVDKHAKAGAIVVIKSTLVPGDAYKLEKLTSRRVVVCPEFMAEGTAARDILKPHRVLVGGSDKVSVDAVIRLYRHWVPASRILRMDAWSAQLTKLFANAMLAQRVSSINSMAALCERGGGDVRAVARAAGMDPRIGSMYLQPSVGFGGSCLEKDLRLLCTLAQCMGLPDVARYWQSVIAQNEARILRVTRQISKMAGKGGRIAVLGLAFKPGVSDLRSSAPMRIAQRLTKLGHAVIAHDPKVKRAKEVRVASTPYAAAENAAVIAVLNDEPAYRTLDWKRVAQLAAPGVNVYACSASIGRVASVQMRTLTLGGAA